MADLPDRIADLARKAAAIDAREGGFWAGANVAALLAWVGRVKKEHAACGKLIGHREGDWMWAECSVHGRLDPPEWVEADRG